MFNNLDADLLSSRTTQYQLIDFDTSFLNKGSKTSSAKGGCVETWMSVEIDPGDKGELVSAGNEEDPEFAWVLKSSYCSLGGGAGSGDGGSGSSGPGGGSSGNNNPSGPGADDTISSPINQDGSDGVCTASMDALNAYYSKNSPFNVDLKEVVKTPCDSISIDDVVNEKFLCIYNKLTKSSKFKTLFIDTFGDSENLNVKFKIVDNIDPTPPSTEAPYGRTLASRKTNPKTGEVIEFNAIIEINKSKMGVSSLSIAKTILHESIHAYLTVKQYKCGGTSLEIINDKELSELLNLYFSTACPGQSDHEFMFDNLIPTMSEILKDIKDDLIPPHHQSQAEDEMFINEDNPATYPDGSYKQDTPWNWEDFYKYFSMNGLQNSDAFQFEMLPKTSVKYENFNDYSDVGTNSFGKDCNN